MSKINVRESLRNIDADSCCKYDLLTMYDACPLTDEDKADIAKLLFDNEDPEVIYQKLCTYFCDDDVSELTGLADVQNVTPFEAIIDNVKMGLGKKCDEVFYNDVAGQFEFKIGDTTYTFGLSPVEYDTDGISVYVDYNYDMPINYTSIKEASEDILNKCNEKVLMASQSNAVLDDDTMEYTVYDVVEDEGRLCAKCMNESTNSFEDIKLGKVNSDAVNELLNNILNNPNYKLTNDCRKKIADNSAPWGIVMSPGFDITATNSLMSTGDFGGSVSFGESEELTFENGDRVTDGNRKGTVIDCDAVQVLVDWDYSETDDIEWVMKEDLSFVNALKESENSPEVTYKQDRRLNSTSVIYKGYLIKLDRVGDGYNVYDKYRELEDTGFPSMEAAKKFVDELVTKDKMYESTTNTESYSTEQDLIDAGYKYVSSNSPYDLYRKIIGGKGDWYAVNYENNTVQHITYAQARGYEPIDDTTGIKRLSKELGKKLLPQNESVDDGVDSNRFLPNMEYCPACGGTRFNVKKGVCADCGYDEGDWGYTGMDDLDEESDIVEEDAEGYVNLREAFEDTDELELKQAQQEFSSAATSINSTKLPAIYSMVNFRAGDVVVDFGGGKFDNAVNYLKDKDVTLLVYDPYNRSAEHNKEVLRILKEHGGADAAVNSNVLNVIKEPEAREAVLRNIKKITKSGAPVYITVYEGKGDGAEGPTKSGYQLNRKTADYMDEIGKVFSNVKRKGKLITAINESINMKENINTDADNIGKGYTAPVMTSLVAKAKELEKRVEEYKDSNDKAVFDRLLPSFKNNILNYKSEVEKDIKDFDEYWKIHKKAMMDNISEADSILKKIGISELSSKVEKLQESYSDDDFIDEMWEAVKDVSGIQDISQGKKPNTYLVTFDSEGSVTARARILLKAFIRANVDIELDSTNGSNVFTFIRPVSDWEFVKGKMIKDSDGFLTSYDWYRNTDSGVNIFMLGYDEADPDYADWETESDTEAEDWFNSYTGFEDDEDEIDESLDESYSVKDVKEFLDEVGGYTDYDGKVEELMHYFGMTKEQSESAIQDCVTSADDEIEESVSSSATAEVISNELKSAAYKLFKTPRWGFETDKEIKDYINPFFDVSEDPKTGDIEVQVRAELDYDNLVNLSNALNKVVSKYDKDAYFEAEQPGIITAVISYS